MIPPFHVRFPVPFEPRHISLAVYYSCLQIACGNPGASA